MTSTEDRETVAYDPMAPAAKQDAESYWRVLREREPIHRFEIPAVNLELMAANPMSGETVPEFYSVLRHKELTEVLTNPKIYSSAEGVGPDRMVQVLDGGVLIWADDPTHLRQRRLAAKAFTPRAVEQLLPRIQATVDSVIDEIGASGSMEVMQDLALPVSIRTITGIMGIPDGRSDDFWRWGNAIIGLFTVDQDAINAGLVGMMEMFDYVQVLVNAIRSGRADTIGPELDTGVLADLVRAEYEGSSLSDEELKFFCLQLIVAGYETTSTATVNGVQLLCTHPDQRAKFEQADDMGVRTAVEEIVRYISPLEGMFRTTTQDTELDGCPIPKGSKVRCVYASANRDERAFTDPHRFDIERDHAELRVHLGFGQGPHTCIGAALARAELRIALETLFLRLPGLELDPEHTPVRNTAFIINGFRELHVRWDPATVRDAG